LHPELEIGDVVVSIDCVQHDMDATPLGVRRGQIPYTEYFTLAADPKLLEAIAGFSSAEYRLRQGRILSGDQFITHTIRQTHGEFFASLNGMAVEMEGAAIALVCRLNSVPFIVVRTVSDRADDSAVMDFDSLAALVAPRSCAVVEHLLAAL
jgi:5'-methylthioadenosine/S-adenosylhomocysteine nucleosidase